MADLRESFVILEDVSTQAGAPLHKATEGLAASGKNAAPMLVAKDNSNNLIYLRTNSAGSLLTTQDASTICKYASGSVAGSGTNVTVASRTLIASKVYKDISWVVSCFRDAVFEIIWINDEAGANVTTSLGHIICGAGDYTDSGQLNCLEFTSGAVGIQKLNIRAMNPNALSDLRATISVSEVL